MAAVIADRADAAPISWRERVRITAAEMLARVWLSWRAPAQVGTREWMDEHLYLPPETGTAKHGKYQSEVTPWMHGILDAFDDPATNEIVCMKSSQVAWTICVTGYLMKRIDVDPCSMVVLFPTSDHAREYNDEKFVPIVDATPVVRAKIDQRTRKSGNRAAFKRFLGGFLKFVWSNSPRAVKGTSAQVGVVEEPDDTSTNVKGQGDSITLFRDRAKTHSDWKLILGGTPTLKDFSAIETAYKRSDQRKLFVPCHHCGEEHVLAWENVKWLEEAAVAHEIYGRSQPETAAYFCPHCGGRWGDYDKNENVKRAACGPTRGWRATAPFNGVAGFGYLSELYVPWAKSGLQFLVRRYLEATHDSAEGNDEKLIAFYNSTLGLPYEYGGEQVDIEAVSARALDYAEGTVPAGGLVLTFGIDVQHNRFAVLGRAFGRGEESWLTWCGELHGVVTDRRDLVWQELEQRVFCTPYLQTNGRALYAAAVSIDSSDGDTSDQVYDWVRAMRRKYPHVKIMPIKGASDKNLDREIFSLPKQSVDHRSPTKATRYGLRVYIVGTTKAKDLLLGSDGKRGRVYLTGEGQNRFHVYRAVRADYWEQLLNSEVKAPTRRLRGRMTWQKRAGRRNEWLDCEVYALHASRAEKIHILTPAQWDALERRSAQPDLFAPPPSVQTPAAAVVPLAPANPPGHDDGGGFGRDEWNL